MKKALALLFALALTASMSSFAFAQDKMDKPADKKEDTKKKEKKAKKEKKEKKEKKDEMKSGEMK